MKDSGMLRIRLGELSEVDRARLQAEIETIVLKSLTVPPFFDARAERERTRPLSSADRARARDFVASLPWDRSDPVEIASSSLVELVQGWLARYLDQSPSATEHARESLRALLPQMAALVSRQLVQVLSNGDGIADPIAASLVRYAFLL
jgi:hypothetical protein